MLNDSRLYSQLRLSGRLPKSDRHNDLFESDLVIFPFSINQTWPLGGVTSANGNFIRLLA